MESRSCKCADDIAKADALPVHKLLIDSFSAGSYGGTGKRVDLDVFSNVSISKPFLLAGGLNEDNICYAMERYNLMALTFQVQWKPMASRTKTR